jgi:hypothetical protein
MKPGFACTRNRSNIELFPGGFGKNMGVEKRYSSYSRHSPLTTLLGEMPEYH